MRKRLHLVVLTAVLVAASLSLFVYKIAVLGFPLRPEAKTDVWRVEVRVSFEATGGPVRVSLFLPHSTGALSIVDQSFVSPGYGITTEPFAGAGIRAVYSIRYARGEQAVYYRAVIQPAGLRDERSQDPVPVLKRPEYEGAQRLAAQAIVDAAVRQSSDPATLAALIVKRLKEARPGDEASFLLGRQPTGARIARVAVDLLRFAGVPARIVNGLSLGPERRNAQFVHWIEYYAGRQWQPLHLTDPKPGSAQPLLPWWRSDAPFVEASGAQGVHYEISTSRSYELATRTALNQQRDLERRLIEFSLFGLPLQAQALFRTIVVIPMGILLLVILRNVVGIKTFGTFMPVLIALAFRQTGLVWGLVFFAIIVTLGLAVRFYFERLKLLLVPRLASVVIVVILILAMLSVLSYRLGFERGLSVGLFPIVILTMTIERMTVVWEERGPAEALQQALGSIAVGSLCYFVMNLPLVEHLFFVFPELLLVVLGATLLLGRYTGYRLTELRRFRVLAR
jgi:hypothetical protein